MKNMNFFILKPFTSTFFIVFFVFDVNGYINSIYESHIYLGGACSGNEQRTETKFRPCGLGVTSPHVLHFRVRKRTEKQGSCDLSLKLIPSSSYQRTQQWALFLEWLSATETRAAGSWVVDMSVTFGKVRPLLLCVLCDLCWVGETKHILSRISLS